MCRSRHRCSSAGLIGHLCMLFVCATFSIQNVLAKQALVHVHPLVFALLRDGGATPVLAVAALVVDGRGRCARCWRPRGWRQWCGLAAGGALGLCGNQIFYLVGLSLTSSTLTAIWNTGGPVLTGLFAWALRQERFSWLRVAGLVVATLGLAGTTVWGAIADADVDAAGGGSMRSGGTAKLLLGTLALLIYVVCCAIFCVMLKPMFAWGPRATTLIAWLYFFGASCLAVAVGIYAAVLAAMAPMAPGGRAGNITTPPATTTRARSRGDAVWDGLQLGAIFPLQDNGEAVGAIVFAALIGSALNYALMTWSNPRVGPTLQALYGIVQIPLTALVALVLLRTVPTVREGAATVVVAIALGLTTAAHVVAERENKEREEQGEEGEEGEEEGETERGGDASAKVAPPDRAHVAINVSCATPLLAVA